MLEIIFLSMVCSGIGRSVRAKGRSAGPYQVMTVLLWFGCELGGAVVGMASTGSVSGNLDPTAYLFALAGAVVGAALSFIIASNLKPVTNPTAYDARFVDKGIKASIGLMGRRGRRRSPRYRCRPPGPPPSIACRLRLNRTLGGI